MGIPKNVSQEFLNDWEFLNGWEFLKNVSWEFLNDGEFLEMWIPKLLGMPKLLGIPKNGNSSIIGEHFLPDGIPCSVFSSRASLNQSGWEQIAV